VDFAFTKRLLDKETFAAPLLGVVLVVTGVRLLIVTIRRKVEFLAKGKTRPKTAINNFQL
jgi:hypothetical protein